MDPRHQENKFNMQSIDCWRKKMSNFDRNFVFKKDILVKGRMIWAANVVKSLEFQPDRVIASVKYNNEDSVVSFDINQDGNLISELNLQDKNISAIICAVCLSIDHILSEYSSSDLGSDDLDSQSEQIIENEDKTAKFLLVKLAIIDQNLVIRAFLDNDERKPIFMQSNRALSIISGDDRKISILRLLFNARKANCKFCFEHRDYRIFNLRDAVSFYHDKLPVWQKYFNVELSSECGLLSRGLLDVSTCAHVTAVDEGKIRIVWGLSTKYGLIDNENLNLLLRANGRPVFLKNIGIVHLSDEQVEVIRSVLALQIEQEIFPYYMLHFLLNQNAITVDTELEKRATFTESLADLSLLPCLKKYQEIGVRWMRSVLDSGCQCLLADEMGLGKTLQVLSLICSDKTAKHNLIICPASVLSVWENEICKFFPEKTVAILGTNTYDSDFILTSYNQARRLHSTVVGKMFDYVVLDEAQYIKNSTSKTARACCNINSRHKIAVTGTPIENNLNDVWSIFKFLMPGLLYNYRDFQKKVVHKEYRSKLRAQIAPFILRRTKESVRLQLPERNEIELLCSLSDVQSKLYYAFKEQLYTSCKNYNEKGSQQERMNILTTIMRMRQTCDCIDILPKKYLSNKGTECPKLDILMLKLSDIVASGKKAVIFSQFLGFLSRIENSVSTELSECRVFKLTGMTGKRKKLVDDFQKCDGSAIMLISLKAGGVGITLHSAEYAFLMEPWWNPAVEEQAIARIHRIGQQKVTTVYRLIAQNTIEQKMRDMQIKKKHLFDEIIQDSGHDVSFEKFCIQNIEEFLN